MWAEELKLTGMRTATAVVLLAMLAACSSTKLNGPAPVVARDVNQGVEKAVLPPGYYRVQPGDTLASIARKYGTDWRALAQLNQIVDPNRLEIDQVLRVKADSVAAVSPAPVGNPPAASGVVVQPVSDGAPAAAPVASPAPVRAEPEKTAPAAPSTLSLIWPARGPIVSRFDGNSNKGVGIGGKLGTPVLAAADGRVVYAGAGLRGYGNLIIVKHDDTFLTAYAHNQALLVKEDQAVKQGQRIAEMGNSESDTVKLHFEVRQLGKPVDPMTYLPKQ
jgi:lipoprotein NlpD